MTYTQNHRQTKVAAVGGFFKAAGKATMNGLAAWGDAIIMNQMPEVGTIFRDRRGNAWICTGYDEMQMMCKITAEASSHAWREAYEQGLTQVWPIKPCTKEHVPDPTAEDFTRSFYGNEA
jgi:hypothetical protein